jgi:acyl carrier protein
MTDISAPVRKLLAEHGRLAVDPYRLPEDSDLYAAGLTSHATVNLMLALEDHFGIEFPERMLRRAAFASIATISSHLRELTQASA